jgi:hypothetical protein
MAKTGKFKCSACDRTFSMAAHLGRHKSTMHAAKKPPTRRVVRVKRRRIGRTAAQPGHVLPAGAAEATAQVRAYRDQLAAQRVELDSQLVVIDDALAMLGGTVSVTTQRVTRRRRGGRRRGSLKDFIVRVLRGRVRPMSVMDITAAVRKAGYATKNKTLDKSVGNALAAVPQAVRVARGQYRLQG